MTWTVNRKQAAVVVLMSLAVGYLLWLPQFRLQSRHLAENGAATKHNITEALMAEHESVRAEILERIRIEHEWFTYKFLVVGALLAGTLGLAGAARAWRTEFRDLGDFLRSREFMIVLGVSVVVCLTIDIQVRRNVLVINQLGAWIATQFEPAVLGANSTPPSNGVYGWEQFLRLPLPTNVPTQAGGGGAGMHASEAYSMLFWPAVHSTTVLCLAAYLVSFAHHRARARSAETLERMLFWLVVGAAILFGAMSRAMPSTFEIKPVPLVAYWTEPAVGSLIAAALAGTLGLFLPAFPIGFALRPRRSAESVGQE